jgi:hypothetical protein
VRASGRKALLLFVLGGAHAASAGCAAELEEQVAIDLVGEGDEPELPKLPPPITAAETRELREAFSWRATRALSETDEDGNPALYYALILIKQHRAFLRVGEPCR